MSYILTSTFYHHNGRCVHRCCGALMQLLLACGVRPGITIKHTTCSESMLPNDDMNSRPSREGRGTLAMIEDSCSRNEVKAIVLYNESRAFPLLAAFHRKLNTNKPARPASEHPALHSRTRLESLRRTEGVAKRLTCTKISNIRIQSSAILQENNSLNLVTRSPCPCSTSVCASAAAAEQRSRDVFFLQLSSLMRSMSRGVTPRLSAASISAPATRSKAAA